MYLYQYYYDDYNEVLKVVGIGIRTTSSQIFNRWGKKLYDNDAFVSWDGTYQGEPVQEGVYLYMLSIKDNKGRMHYLKRTGNGAEVRLQATRPLKPVLKAIGLFFFNIKITSLNMNLFHCLLLEIMQ